MQLKSIQHMDKKQPGASNRGLSYKLVVLVTDETQAQLAALARLRGVSIGHVVREAVAAYIRPAVAA